MLSQNQKSELSAGIGASECAAVLGIDPYMTPYELWLYKTGRKERVISNEDAVIMGHLLEPVVAKRYAQLTNQRVAKVNAAYKHKDYPHIICHLDRKIVGKQKAVEIKTANPFSRDWGEAGTDEVPFKYIAQVQHQLAATGWQEDDLIVFRGTTDLRIYPFQRDEETISMIVDKVNHFWNHHILKDIPPEPTTRGDLSLIYPSNNGQMIQATPEIVALISKINVIKQNIKELQSTQEKLEKEVIQFIADNDGLLLEDQMLATFKANKNGIRSLRLK